MKISDATIMTEIRTTLNRHYWLKRKSMNVKFFIVIIWLFGCGNKDVLPEIAKDTFWEIVTPSSQEMNEEVILELESLVSNFDNVLSFLMIRNGKIVHEQYYNGAKANTLLHIRSITKRVIASLVGIAIDKSHIESSATAITDFFPEAQESGVDPKWQEINVYHLLNMISGMDWIEATDLGQFDKNFDDPVSFIFWRNITKEPATYFSYNSPGTHLLSYIIARSSGQIIADFAQENLFEPLGINGFNWQSDGNNVENGGAGLELTARDLAKIGLLYLQNGTFLNKEVISEEWITESLHLPVNLDTLQGSYLPGSSVEISKPGRAMGNTWWTSTFQGEIIHYGDGYGGQVLLLIPKYDVIVVMNRIHTVDGEQNGFAFGEFFGQILPRILESVE